MYENPLHAASRKFCNFFEPQKAIGYEVMKNIPSSHLTNMKHLFFIVLIVTGCASTRKTIEICELRDPGKITVKMVQNDLTTYKNYILEGTAYDVTGEPFPFMKVKLTDKNDENNIVGTFTNENGFFSLTCEEGAYWLEISSVGYEPYTGEIMAFFHTHEVMEIHAE